MPASTDLGALPPLAADPFVTVVMPVRNEAAFIAQSLGAVLGQDLPAERYEVIVSDGQSTDGTRDLVASLAGDREHPQVRVVDNPRRTAPAALNVAIAEARGDLIVRIDGHSEVPPDFLRRLVDLSRTTGAACVGGRVTTVGENETGRAIAAAQSSRFGVGGVAFRHADDAGPVDTVLFGAYRREVFDAIGPFDEELVRNQDDEFNLRLIRAGGVVWMDPSLTFLHFARPSYRALWRQYAGYGRYKPMVMRKHRVVVSPRHLVPSAFVVALAGSVAAAAVTRRPALAGAVLGPYAVATGINAVRTGREAGVSPARVAVATTVLHLSYGVGVLRGFVQT
jgi:glycosyltransferase involved in cell wall biosynthesis